MKIITLTQESKVILICNHIFRPYVQNVDREEHIGVAHVHPDVDFGPWVTKVIHKAVCAGDIEDFEGEYFKMLVCYPRNPQLTKLLLYPVNMNLGALIECNI